jgi:hypothetical protein
MKTNGNQSPSAESAKTKVVGFAAALPSPPVTELDVTTMLSATAVE